MKAITTVLVIVTLIGFSIMIFDQMILYKNLTKSYIVKAEDLEYHNEIAKECQFELNCYIENVDTTIYSLKLNKEVIIILRRDSNYLEYFGSYGNIQGGYISIIKRYKP